MKTPSGQQIIEMHITGDTIKIAVDQEFVKIDDKTIKVVFIDQKKEEDVYPKGVDDLPCGCTGITSMSFNSEIERKKTLALIELRKLMNEYNRIDNGGEDWMPSLSENCYAISRRLGEDYFDVEHYPTESKPLIFRKMTTAHLFLDRFEALIIKAGDLI